MKIIHCADLHLDSSMKSNFDKEKGKKRKAELFLTYNNMIQYAADNGVEAVIIAGDLYDVKSISVTARNTFLQSVINHPEITFFYLRGNHDASDLLGSMEIIPDNLKLFDDGWTTYNISDKITLSGVELSSSNAAYIYAGLVLDIDKINLVTLHGQETDTGSKDKTEVIALRELKNKGIDYLALGHIHSYKKEVLDARGVYCYPGCLEGRGYDECGSHGFVLLDIDEANHYIESTFVPFARRTLYELQVDISDCMSTSDVDRRIRKEILTTSISSDDMLKVCLVGRVSMNMEKDDSIIMATFEKEYFHFKLEDNTSIYVDYSSFIHDKSFKGEFVRTVMDDNTLSEDEKTQIVKMGVKLLLGEEI